MDLLEVSKRGKEIENRHPWELARFKVVNDLLKDVIKNSEDFNVFDIGCGDIYFVERLSDLYPLSSFYAIDISFTDEILESYKKMVKGKRIFLFKTLNEARAALGKAPHLILLLDVVEHIENDHQFLKGLTEDGVVDSSTSIAITVPAYQSLFCSHDHFLGHFRRYTNNTLSKLIEATGYERVRIGYFFMSLIPPRIVQVIKERSVKKNNEGSTGLVAWNGSKFITSFLENVLLVDYFITKTIKKVFRANLPGLSNYVICKKRV